MRLRLASYLRKSTPIFATGKPSAYYTSGKHRIHANVVGNAFHFNSMEEIETLEQYDYVEDDYFDHAMQTYGEALGKFLMKFSTLEHELNIAISDILSQRAHDIGYMIMERMRMIDKIELFYRLYNSLECFNEKKGKQGLSEIKKAFISMSEFRNYLAHANWQTIKKNGAVRIKFMTDKDSGYIKFRNIIIKPKEIRAKTKEIDKIINKLLNYTERAHAY